MRIFPVMIILLSISFSAHASEDSTSNKKAPNWIQQSNRIADEYSIELGQLYPEVASHNGYKQFDSEVMSVVDDIETRQADFLTKWQKKLNILLKKTTDSNLHDDLQVMINFVEGGIRYNHLQQKYGFIPFEEPAQVILGSLMDLLGPQATQEQKLAAQVRLQKYVHGFKNYKPLVVAYESRIRFVAGKPSPRMKFYPAKESIETYLKNSDSTVEAVKTLLKGSGLVGWEQDFALLQSQISNYNAFIKSAVLPLGRTDYKIPEEMYANRLKANGVDVSPQELIRLGLQDYKNLYLEFNQLLKTVAQNNSLSSSDPQTVFSFLRTKVVKDQKSVQALYQKVSDDITAIIKQNDLVTVPDDPVLFSFASAEVSKAMPIPYLLPPRLIGNTGEKPLFIIPTTDTGDFAYDDFAYEAAAYDLFAHEGRPGHDLQFRSILESGVSTIRATYAFNSTNVEGWALYSEMMMYPYATLEAKLVILQMRLLRIARMFLEPQLELGATNTNEISKKLFVELGFTEKWAQLEAWRYSSLTGQATSYQFGYKKILKIKEEVRKAVGAKFTEKCFNDRYLKVGLLPIDLIGERLKSSLKCK